MFNGTILIGNHLEVDHMNLNIQEWDESVSEFHVFPMLCVVKHESVISIQIGWLAWVYDFTFIY